MLKRALASTVLVAAVCLSASTSRAQETRCWDSAVPRQAVRDFGHYAVAIVKSPKKLAHLNRGDALYLLGFSAGTAALIATDTRISNSISSAHEDRSESNYASNILVGAAIGTSTIKYLVGCREHNRQRRDDAVREWEAMAYGLASVGAVKYIFRRQRPFLGSKGEFFDSGTSFPSGHSAIGTAWAATLGEEYPSAVWKYVALGGAGVVSGLRITARKHYPSDALVGGMIGYLTGEYICRHNKCREEPVRADAGPAGAARGTPDDQHNPGSATENGLSSHSMTAYYVARRQFCDSISPSAEQAARCASFDSALPSR